MLAIKADIASQYAGFFESIGVDFVRSPTGTTSNYWLNAIVLGSHQERDTFLTFTNSKGVMTRPIWRLMSKLVMFQNCQHDGLLNSLWLEERVVNIPSSVPNGALKAFNGETL